VNLTYIGIRPKRKNYGYENVTTVVKDTFILVIFLHAAFLKILSGFNALAKLNFLHTV
tara:strand:+ start:363 stop:536 length:174 start_codon:yes stop_codon:yes gene_type:complete